MILMPKGDASMNKEGCIIGMIMHSKY